MSTRQRVGKEGQPPKVASVGSQRTSLSSEHEEKQKDPESSPLIKGQPIWVVLAIASGACAAINGVFAKLTTTALTTNLAYQLSILLGLAPENNTVNVALRGVFFGLNLLFNGVMWALFTAALTKGNSTTRVSIVNVSANFVVTAMLGWAIFDEKLPVGWWIGAGLLAAGNVVIGRREETETKTDKSSSDSTESSSKKWSKQT